MENPWLAWYPGEYIGKTRSLTMAQHGAYMLLLWEYYINGPFVANATGLLNVCCGKSEADEVDMDYVLERFFTLKDGYWHHLRADEEIAKRATIREKRKLIGRRGGLAKASVLLKQKPTQSQSQSHIQEPKAKAASAFVLPEWVPQEAWDDYEEMRRKIRKPMTDQARIWGVNKLASLRAQGHDPKAVLDQSTFSSWQGLFPVRSENNDGNKKSAGYGIDRGNHPPEPGTQAKRAFNNFAAVAAVVGGSDRVPEKQRSSGVADRRLTDGTRQTP